MDLEARERACLELLQRLPVNDYVLIGGYAVSSFDLPRFSVDLDIVIDRKREKSFVKANVDLLINAVISRQTGSSYSFAYLLKHSETREVIGFSGSLQVRARVANREMLIALKANSMRLADQRDIIALCTGEIDTSTVVKHLKRCPREIILKHIENFLKTLDDERHKDSIKGVFRLSDDVYDRVTKRAQKLFSSIWENLNGS